MKTILDLLKSIKFWTIVGVIVSILGLYYTIHDNTDKGALSLSIGPYPIKSNKELVVCCLFEGWRAGAPLLMQMPFDIANISNKTIENVSLNYMTDVTELENFHIFNKSITPPVALSPMYYSTNGVDFEPFEVGGGVYAKSITPMTSAGSAQDACNVFHPMICPNFSEDYFMQELPKFTLILRGDDCKEVSYSVRIIPVFINAKGDQLSKAMNKLANQITDDIGAKRTSMIIVGYTYKENVMHKIGGITFVEMIPNKDNCLIYTK